MKVQNIFFNIFLTFCFQNQKYAVWSKKDKDCECDIIQVSKSQEPNKYYEFTRQSGKINGRPFYFSITGN